MRCKISESTRLDIVSCAHVPGASDRSGGGSGSFGAGGVVIVFGSVLLSVDMLIGDEDDENGREDECVIMLEARRFGYGV